MSVNGITNVAQTYDNSSTGKTKADQNKKTETTEKKSADNDKAAVYEKSDDTVVTKKVYQRDNATINRLLEDAERRHQGLRDLVEKMLLKQGQTLSESTDIYGLLREGKLDVDPETRAQAQKDIAEDGYWGVEQTSERLVSFAKALAGGDPSKADLMMDAVLKGFQKATEAWGGELPDICQRTLDTTMQKLEQWKKSTQE